MSKQHQWTFKQKESGNVTGPVSEGQFVALVKNGTIQSSTLVCSPTRTKNKWYAAGRITAIAKLFEALKVEDVTVAANEAVGNPLTTPIRNSGGPKSHGPEKSEKDICDQFQPLNSKPVVWLLRATMLAMAINGVLISCLLQSGRRPSSSLATSQTGAFIIQLVLVIATAIFFLRWKYQAYKNLQVACKSPLKTSAGWAVGVYFIPILNLFRPAMAMHEIQSRSQANIGLSVYGWWALWILSGVLTRATLNTRGAIDERIYVVSIVTVCLSLIAGFLLLKIIRTVTEKQRRYWLSLKANLA